MPAIHLPLSGNVSQAINPWTWLTRISNSQFSLFTINLGRSADPEMERMILDEVGSYGRQIGRIADALGVVLERLDQTELGAEDRRKVRDALSMFEEIDRMKARGAPGVTRR